MTSVDVETKLEQELADDVDRHFSFDNMYREMASISGNHGWLAIAQSQMGLYNPDDISIETYKTMLDDENVGGALDVLRLAVLSTDWNLNYDGEDERMKTEIIPWLQSQLENVNSSLGGAKGIRHVLWEMMLAIAFGHIPSEKVFKRPSSINGRIELERLKPIDPETIRKYDVDERSNLKGLIQSAVNRTDTGIVLGATGEGIYINKRKLLLYTHNMSFQNWWGKSDFRRIYRSWFIKQFVIKFWNIAIEKYALPWTVGRTEDDKDAKLMLAKIRELHKTSSVSLGTGKNIEFLKGIVDRSAFLDAIEYHDRKILMGLLVPPSQLESTVGAYSQSKVQKSTFMLRVKYIQKELEAVVEQLIKEMIDLNFSNINGKYPTFNFEEPDIEDSIQMSNAINAAISAGYVDVETDFGWIRERVGFPEASPDAVIKRGSTPMQFPGPGNAAEGQFKDPQVQRQPGAQDVTRLL